MKHVVGNILDVKQGLIVQQVNAQGVMGSGLAKAIRAKWPVVWDEYNKWMEHPRSRMNKGRDILGQVQYIQVEPGLWVANLVGQQFYGRGGIRFTSYDALDAGFAHVKTILKIHPEMGPVNYPLIGCGLGGGNWAIVSQIIKAQLDKMEHTVWLTKDFETAQA